MYADRFPNNPSNKHINLMSGNADNDFRGTAHRLCAERWVDRG